jgi:hypothetical protein
MPPSIDMRCRLENRLYDHVAKFKVLRGDPAIHLRFWLTVHWSVATKLRFEVVKPKFVIGLAALLVRPRRRRARFDGPGDEGDVHATHHSAEQI